MRFPVEILAEDSQELQGTWVFGNDTGISEVGLWDGFSICTVAGCAVLRIRAARLFWRKDSPPPGGVDILNGTQRGNQKAERWKNPDEQGKDDDRMRWNSTQQFIDPIAVH